MHGLRRFTAAFVVVMAPCLVARSGEPPLSQEQVDAQERDNRSDLFQDETGARSRCAAEVEIATDVDWNGDDQHGAIGPGFSWSYAPREVENFRFISLFAGAMFGQFGDEGHRWVHLQTGYRPSYEIPVDFELKPFIGARAHLGMTTFYGPGPQVDGTASVGGSVGARLLGGILSAEITGDALHSWNLGFLVDGRQSYWAPRFGFNVKSDLCAFAGGDICQYAAPTPEDVDLTALMDEALSLLDQKLGSDHAATCQLASEAVTLQVETHESTCGEADADGFFCRLAKGSSPKQAALVELARRVHSELAACYAQGRVDERDAEKRSKLLVRKLRYGAYPPELRRALGCDSGFSKAQAVSLPADPAAKEDVRRCEIADLRERAEPARLACPRAARARDLLEQTQ